MSDQKLVPVLCIKCTRLRQHKILKEYSTHDESGILGVDVLSILEEYEEWAVYRIIRCRHCGEISFQKRYWNSFDEITEEPIVTETLYPSRTVCRQTISAATHFPLKVKYLYKETLKAFNVDAPTVAAIGLRAVVEAICRDQKCEGKDLKQKIDALVTRDLLSKAEADFLHIHRLIGNEAAHEAVTLTAEDLNSAIDILEHLLKTLYETPSIAAKLKLNRAKRVVKPAKA
jgi:hypothetical protein